MDQYSITKELDQMNHTTKNTAISELYSIEMTGIKALQAELIIQAVRDYNLPFDPKVKRNRLTRNEKRVYDERRLLRHDAFLFINSTPFEEICHDLNVCPIRLRKKIFNRSFSGRLYNRT